MHEAPFYVVFKSSRRRINISSPRCENLAKLNKIEQKHTEVEKILVNDNRLKNQAQKSLQKLQLYPKITKHLSSQIFGITN